GSAITAIRPVRVPVGGTTVRPPACPAWRGVLGVADREIRTPGPWHALFLPGLGADAPVAAAGVDDRDGAAATGLVLPAEQRPKERLGPPGVGGGQLVPAQGANIIDQRGADARARLPQRHDRAGRSAIAATRAPGTSKGARKTAAPPSCPARAVVAS